MVAEFINPGVLFLENNKVKSVDDFLKYADFLRCESGLTDSPPINLQRIYERFMIPTPALVDLGAKIQGMVLENSIGSQILINEKDPHLRQRFTQAHELMEILYKAVKSINPDIWKLLAEVNRNDKENICDIGAAHLLMPLSSFQVQARQLGLSIHSGEVLASIYEVSLTAALINLIKQYPNSASLVVWRMKNKPSELKNLNPMQNLLPGFPPISLPEQKLRVEWSSGRIQGVFFPKNKSIPDKSSVYTTWQTGAYSTGVEDVIISRREIRVQLENKAYPVGDERQVLSLIAEVD